MTTRSRALAAALVAAALLSPGTAPLAQQGAPDTLSPGDVRPGSEKPQDAVHGGGAPQLGAPATPGAMPARRPFSLKVKVQKVDAEGKKVPMAGADVLLDAMASPQMKIKTYTEKADADGVATFSLTAVEGSTYIPKVLSDGINFTGEQVVPDADAKAITIDVFGKTFDDSGVIVSELMTTVDLTEGQLVFMQMWTFVNTSPFAFDPSGALNSEKYKKGLPIQLPKKAQGAHATVMLGKGVVQDAELFEDMVFVKAPIPPQAEGQDPLRVQIRFGMPLEDAVLEYSQPLLYKIEGMRVIVSLQTRFAKMPELALQLEAPGFPSVGDGREMPGMRKDQKVLVARDGHAEPGGALNFTVSGYPAHDPPERKIALALFVLILIVGGVVFLRERRGAGQGGKNSRELRIKALTDEREDLFDALRDLEERFDQGELGDRAYDIEVARLRERLALVLRRLDQAQSADNAA